MGTRGMNSLLLAAVISLASACVHQPPEKQCPIDGVDSSPTAVCDPDVVYFERDVLPILRSNCAKSGCHDALSAAEDVILDSYNSTMQTADVKPCNAEGSELIEVLRSSGEKAMPPAGNTQLTQAQIAMLEKWVSQGAENFICQSDCDTTNVTFAANISPLISTNCQGCHSGASPSAGILLTNYTEVKALVTNGSMMAAVTSSVGFVPMPPSGPLDPCKIHMLELWIADGAQDN